MNLHIILIIVPFNISLIKRSTFKIQCVAVCIRQAMNMVVKQSYGTMVCSHKAEKTLRIKRVSCLYIRGNNLYFLIAHFVEKMFFP